MTAQELTKKSPRIGAALRLYLDGMPCADIEQVTGVGIYQVNNARYKRGIPPRRLPRITPEVRQLVLDLAGVGLGTRGIAERVGIGLTSVKRILAGHR